MTIGQTRTQYYTDLKTLAREVREKYGLTAPRVTLKDMRRIYKGYEIKIHTNRHKLTGVRGAYMNDELGVTVMINGNLPDEQRIFTLAHELKHHLADQGKSPESEEEKARQEKGAEIFAVELIFPEHLFLAGLSGASIGLGECTAEHIVALKRTSQTTLSFTSLGKYAEILGYAPKGSLAKVQWRKLEEQMYGEPEYKRIVRYRQARAARSI